MKRNATTLILFFLTALLISGQNGCSGTASNTVANADANSNTANANTSAPAADSSSYPPLASGLADADFEMLDGTKFKFSDRKGKVVLLNIWGTWCGPCRAEMPTLMALQDKYRDKGFEVIGFNIGDGNGVPETNEQINKFVEEMKLNYTIARSSNANTRQFYAVTKQEVVPQSVLVDRAGRLRGVFIGGGPRVYASLEDTIAKVMAD
jgi:thiol-disulfide isomerase/thioredoxin